MQTIPSPATEPVSMHAKSSKHIPALDGIRAIAVLMILFLHLGGGARSHNPIIRYAGMLTRGGWIGVSLFFVLSGFLISGILWDSRNAEHRFRNFYARRSLRIFPLYYFALLLATLAAAYAGILHQCLSKVWIWLLYLQNVHLPGLAPEPVLPSPLPIGHFWSLAVEEQFYLIWPLLLTSMKTLRQARWLCLITFLLSTVIHFAFYFAHFDLRVNFSTLLFRCGELAFGGYIAMAYRSDFWPRLQAWAPVGTLLAIFVYTFLCFRIGVQREFFDPTLSTLFGLPCLSILFGGFIILAVGTNWISRFASMAWLRWIGKISYGLYVYHVILIPVDRWIAHRIAPSGSEQTIDALVFLVGITLTFLVAYTSFRFIETPFIRFKDRFQNRPRTRRTVLAS